MWVRGWVEWVKESKGQGLRDGSIAFFFQAGKPPHPWAFFFLFALSLRLYVLHAQAFSPSRQ